MARPSVDPKAVANAEEIRLRIRSDEKTGKANAAKYILTLAKKGTLPHGRVALTEAACNQLIWKYCQHLLNREQFEAAATILWGRDVFDPRPQSTQLVWDTFWTSDKIMAMGAGSMSKSYSGAVWFLCDWLRDPEWTCIKVLSVTEEHAKRNVFAHIKNLHRSACVPLPGLVKATSIQANEDDKQGIHLVTIPQGDEGKGRLRGFHPVPRSTGAHKLFGILSRIRVVLDEAEEIPGGVWEDVDNILITMSSEFYGHIKVFGATNPKDRMSRFGLRCEPIGGWSTVNIEDSVRWQSILGWTVIRLDGARCENVVEKRVVFPGLLTHEGFRNYLLHGDTTPEYYTMARGWFPEQGVASNVIPYDIAEKSIGTFRFVSPTTNVVALDLALEGDDLVIASLGRTGTVDGWTDRTGVFHRFETLKQGVQLDQQIPFAKKRTLELAQDIVSFCKRLHIPPNCVCVDRTGNGSGVHDALCSIWNPDVMGINFGRASTDYPIMEDDTEKASDVYEGIVTELVFCLRKFMEFHVLKLSPTFRHDMLIRESTSRRYRLVGKKSRVESKKEYMKRTQSKSPDHMDSASLLVHLIRTMHPLEARMTPPPKELDYEFGKDSYAAIDRMEYVDFDENT